MSSKIKVQIEGSQGSQLKRPTTPKTKGSTKGQMGRASRGKGDVDVRVNLGSRRNK